MRGIRGDAKSYSAPAEMFVGAGAHYIVPDFTSVADAGGSLFPMAEQMRRAIAWVWRNAASFGGDPDRLYIGGQSSGAHLAAVALTTDWPRDFDVPADIVKGGLCASGMYELAPVRLSARANYVKFTDAMVEALSPIRHLDRLGAPVIVSYGTYETPEFIAKPRNSPPRCAMPGNCANSSSPRTTATSTCPRRCVTPTACSATRC